MEQQKQGTAIQKRVIDAMKEWDSERLRSELEIMILTKNDESLKELFFDDIATEEEHGIGTLMENGRSNMDKKDFSIRIEVEAMLQNIGMVMTKEQIGDVVETVEQHDTLLGIVGLFVSKGIKEIAERDGLPLDEDEIEHQFMANRKFINYEDL